MNPNQTTSQTDSQKTQLNSNLVGRLNQTVPDNLPLGALPNSSDIKKVASSAPAPKVVSSYQSQQPVEKSNQPTVFSVLPAEFRGEVLRRGRKKQLIASEAPLKQWRVFSPVPLLS